MPSGESSIEVTTVAEDEAVLFDLADRPVAIRMEGLAPDTTYEHGGAVFRTLPRPPGSRLATIATVNDLHFGETECGAIDGLEAVVGPILRSPPGAEPYPEVMNQAAVAEIRAIEPGAVVAKGDLTTSGTEQEYQAFLDCYRPVFRDRLHWIRGNHDGRLAEFGPQEITLPGVILAILDTTIPGWPSGRLPVEQLEWLDELGARADRPVLVFGHHHCWDPGSRSRPATYFGINPDDSEGLIEVVARRPALAGYFAGHTHRNRVRRFDPTGTVPWVEVACVKDFPGSWAEYRVFEGGILQVHRRIASPAALEWSESCRAMVDGLYPAYAFGRLTDRCFPIWPR